MIILSSLFRRNGAQQSSEKDVVQREIMIMSSFNHPSTVRLFAWSEAPRTMQVVMELAVGDLRNYYKGKLDNEMQRPYSDAEGLVA